MTGAQPVQVTEVSAPGCHFCDDARAALSEFAKSYPVQVQTVDADSADGQALLARYGVGMFPLVLVDGMFFSAGRLPRRKLSRLLTRPASTPAGGR